MMHGRVARLAWLVLLASTLTAHAAATSPECPRWREAFAGMPTKMVTIQVGARTLALRAKTADTSERQAGGFQCATPEEIQRHLILFDFGQEIATQFHMNNVPAALDIAFVKADGRIFSILKMEPSPTNLYGPMGPFRYAIEARAGFFESQGIRQGEARLVLSRDRALSGVHRHETHGARHKHGLRAAFALTAAFLLIEAAVGLWTGSLSLLADAAHMLVDAGGLLLSLFAVWFAERPAPPEKTYGYYRVEILAALVNGVVLCLLALAILAKAYERLWHPQPVPGGPILAVAVVGLGVNLLSMRLLHAGAAESLNVRSAYLEVLGDAASSAAVIVAGAVILLTGWSIADPIASAAIALFILPRTWSLLRQAVNVLLEAAPAHIDVAQIEAVLTGAAGVRRVHDLHVWTLTSGREAMSAHVVVSPDAVPDRILDALHVILHTRFGIDHTTIQVETEPAPLIQITSPRA